jgi:hypothetical protein
MANMLHFRHERSVESRRAKNMKANRPNREFFR